MIGDIVNDSWILLKRIGKGTFSEIYLASNFIVENSYVALKVQKPSTDISSVLKWESEVLKALRGLTTVPKFVHFDSHNKDKYEYLAMEYLSGEDMSKLRDFTRNSIGAIPLAVVCYLSWQMFECTKNLHGRGYVHRDIKPANFVRRNSSSTEYCMLDFGITKLHWDKHRVVRPMRENVDFRGTSTYASLRAHNKEDLGPRDDCFSLIYVFADLLCGSLPWTDAARARDKNAVLESKRKFHESPEEFLEWVISQAQSTHKNMGDLDEGFTDRLRISLHSMLAHLNILRFEDSADFGLMQRSLLAILDQPVALQEVSEITYTKFGFHWNCGQNDNKDPQTIIQTPECAKLLSDISVIQNIIYAKGKYLGRQMTKSQSRLQRVSTSAASNEPQSLELVNSSNVGYENNKHNSLVLVSNTPSDIEQLQVSHQNDDSVTIALATSSGHYRQQHQLQSIANTIPSSSFNEAQGNSHYNIGDDFISTQDVEAILLACSHDGQNSTQPELFRLSHVNDKSSETSANLSSEALLAIASSMDVNNDIAINIKEYDSSHDEQSSQLAATVKGIEELFQTIQPWSLQQEQEQAQANGLYTAININTSPLNGSGSATSLASLYFSDPTNLPTLSATTSELNLTELALNGNNDNQTGQHNDDALIEGGHPNKRSRIDGASGYRDLEVTDPLFVNQQKGISSTPRIRKSSVSSYAPAIDISYGLRWKDLVEELSARIPIDQIRKETIDLFEGILRDFSRFYQCRLSTGEEDLREEGEDDVQKWNQFVGVQQAVYEFSEKTRKKIQQLYATPSSTPAAP